MRGGIEMNKTIRILVVVTLLLALYSATLGSSAEGKAKPWPHEQPLVGAGGVMLMAWATFDNPNYYYAPITNAPSGVYYRQAGLSPDGTKIVAAKTWTEGSITRREVVLMNADGTNEVVISPGDSGEGDIYQYGNPFWSDDGTAVGFVEVHNDNPNKVVRYDLATSSRTYIYEPTAPDDVANADFLGGSKTAIVFWDYGAGGNVADLFIWDGTTRTNITNTPDYKEYEPVSNADGTKIVYWSGETTAEPVDTTHTLTYSGGTWVKDLGFTPILGSYWSYWTTPEATQIATTMLENYNGTIDLYLYDATGAFVADLTGPSYTGGNGQWNFFGGMPQGPNGEFVITSNAGRTVPGRDIVIAAPRATLYVDDAGSDFNPGTEAAPFATIQKGVNEAISCGTVYVAAGTYNERQILITKAVTVQGAGIDQSIIDGDSYVGLPSVGLVHIETTGDVTFTGFTLREAGDSGTDHVRVGIFARSPAAGNTFTITHNKILGSNNPDDDEDYGFYAHSSYANLVFQYNRITQTGANSILLERHFGATDVSYNTLDVGCYGTDAYFNMTYNGDVTTPQIVHGNTFDMGTGGPFDYDHRAAAISFVGAFTGAAGKFTNVQITDNVITNLKPYRRGPTLWNNFGGDGSGGAIENAVIRGNIIIGTGTANSDGIRLIGKAVNTLIEDNLVTNVDRSFRGWLWNGHIATGTVIRNNVFMDNITGLVWEGTEILNAEYNYWGAPDGPGPVGPGSGDKVSTNVDYEPWLGYVPPEVELQEVLDASCGKTVYLGSHTYKGGLTLNCGLALQGVLGTVITAGSHGITVAANDVTIDSVTLDGTGGSSGDCGIWVVDGVERLWVRKSEIRNWPDDGIHFAGAITGLKIVDNYIHDNGGDGVEFTQTPGGSVYIYGNAFRANTGYGINNGGATAVDAEYNEWGDVAGPTGTNGDGVSSNVDYDPWVFAKLWVDAPATVRELESVTVYAKMDVHHLYGGHFSLTFPKEKLQLTAEPAIGAFKTTTSGAFFHTSTMAQANATGVITFTGQRADPDAEYDATGDVLLTLQFQAQEISGVSQDAVIAFQDDTADMAAKDGVRIFLDGAISDTVKILGTTTVSGVVDLQGRDNDAGAVITTTVGALYGYQYGPVTAGPWGTYALSNVTDDTYTFWITMERYLDAYAEVVVSGDNMTLKVCKLLGGDANDDDVIDILDAGIIGGAFGTSPPSNPKADINNDGVVDILDLVLFGGNYMKTTPVPWTPT